MVMRRQVRIGKKRNHSKQQQQEENMEHKETPLEQEFRHFFLWTVLGCEQL